jgi:hypothetical protein
MEWNGFVRDLGGRDVWIKTRTAYFNRNRNEKDKG